MLHNATPLSGCWGNMNQTNGPTVFFANFFKGFAETLIISFQRNYDFSDSHNYISKKFVKSEQKKKNNQLDTVSDTFESITHFIFN